MAFCDFCTCDDCRDGRPWLSHAKTEDGRWICDVCYHYEACLQEGYRRGAAPCKDINCEHRPKLVGEWVAGSGECHVVKDNAVEDDRSNLTAAELESVCSPEEARSRIDAARRFLKSVTRGD